MSTEPNEEQSPPPPSLSDEAEGSSAAAAGAGAGGASSAGAVNKGTAGRIDYAKWDKVADSLAKETDLEMSKEEEEEKKKLGLDGKYARSQAEAEEREKAKQVKKVKKTLDKYKQREEAVIMTCLQGREIAAHETVRITRHELDAGTRVVRVQETKGVSPEESVIVLTQDLSSLESKMKANAMAKTYPGDVENTVPPEAEAETEEQRTVLGIIKAFFSQVSNCTILVKCKIISGMIELHHCDNVVVKVMGPEATVATVQTDLSSNITLEFHDAPSGKNTPLPYQKEPSLYWGQDKDDRIFHAGVRNLTVRLYRDGLIDMECHTDYLEAGAVPVGNSKAEEMQFVTSVIDGVLLTESVVRAGLTTGQQVRAMTQREMDEQEAKRKRAAEMATHKAEEMVQVKDKQGNPVVVKTPHKLENDDEPEEVLSPAIQQIVDECSLNKKRGNEAFAAGEYGQAILLYSLALDKAEELGNGNEHLFPRDVVYSNRAACFLKLGQHEKAEADAMTALKLNPNNLKALFRRGLALHALQQYQEALPLLAEAHKQEPHNKQIKQALQFCEVRMEQEYRKRMAGDK